MGASEHGAPFSCDAWENNKDLSGGRLGGRGHVPERAVDPVHPRHDPHVPLRRRQSALRGRHVHRSRAPATRTATTGIRATGASSATSTTAPPACRWSATTATSATGSKLCNENTGLCGKSNGITCDDDNECTTGTCRPDFLCTYTNVENGSACDDGNLCTGQNPGFPTGGPPGQNVCPAGQKCDVCTNGVCGGTLNTDAANLHCEDNNVCNGIMACDPTTGNSCVQTVPPLTCAPDTNPCTTDTCDPVLGCNWPNTRSVRRRQHVHGAGRLRRPGPVHRRPDAGRRHVQPG